MRRWKLNPRILCDQHLLGEHVDWGLAGDAASGTSNGETSGGGRARW